MKTGGQKTHGHRTRALRSKEYSAWDHIKARCNNPSSANYKFYGGRGIVVCERWNVFANFLEDMGTAPSALHSIDRIDVNGNYEPTNCRWATNKEQQNNRTDNVILIIDGVVKTASQWSEFTGLPVTTILSRAKKGIKGVGLIAPKKANFSGGDNNCARFTNKEREDIVNLFKSGVIKADIARRYNAAWGTISSVIKSELNKAHK